MTEYESILIDRCVKSRYGFLDEEERIRIGEITKEIAKREQETGFPSYGERLKGVMAAAEKYLAENGTIVPGGFVDFRLREVYYNVEEMVARGAEQFFDEKETEEFTSLLSAFVKEKKPGEELIHLVWNNGSVRLINKRGRDVTDKYEREFYPAAIKRGLGEEDLAISAIISAAPERLVLHSPPAGSPLKETLEKIFSGRCKTCTGCNICKIT